MPVTVAPNNTGLPLSGNYGQLSFEEAVLKAIQEGTMDAPVSNTAQVTTPINVPIKGTDVNGNTVNNTVPVIVSPNGTAVASYPQPNNPVPISFNYNASMKPSLNPSLLLPAASPSPTSAGVNVQTFAVTGVAGVSAVDTYLIIAGSGQTGLVVYYILGAPTQVIKSYDEYSTAELTQLGGASGAVAFTSLLAGLDNYGYVINNIRLQTTVTSGFGAKRLTIYKLNYSDTGADGRPFPISVFQTDKTYQLTIGMVDFVKSLGAPLILSRDMAIVIPVSGSVAPAAPETLTVTFELGVTR
jgi:hypothetical protein